ncbi:MAG TPA: hypothetical protein VLE94_08780, partial [Burkholderiaceae bacterium]|nr:hypothetical protein [Burkholderiaceae bacterium]
MVRAGILPTFQPIRHEACHCALLRAFLVIAMLALGACGSGGDDQGASPPVASGPGQEITAAGGTVETADHAVKLNIPAGALDAPTAIVVNRLDPGAPP